MHYAYYVLLNNTSEQNNIMLCKLCQYYICVYMYTYLTFMK